jgi:hypothetical protein
MLKMKTKVKANLLAQSVRSIGKERAWKERGWGVCNEMPWCCRRPRTRPISQLRSDVTHGFLIDRNGRTSRSYGCRCSHLRGSAGFVVRVEDSAREERKIGSCGGSV